MLETGFGLPELMEKLGRQGVTMILKVDQERFGFGEKPWTIVLSGPALGELRSLHSDFHTLREALAYCLSALRSFPGEWEWLDEYSLD